MTNQKTLAPMIREMEIGGRIEYPLERMRAVRATCSMIGLEMNRQYTTRIDKERRIIEVNRVA